MKRTLEEHITHLEEKIVTLNRELRAGDLSPYEREEKVLELANAKEALKLFRRAYELERAIPE